MANVQTKKYDEATSAFYVQQICSEADAVFRFCYVLTLSQDSARELVEGAFDKVAVNLKPYLRLDSAEIRKTMLKECYQQFQRQSGKASFGGNSPIAKFLRDMPVLERAGLFSVDVIGHSVTEAMGVLGCKEDELRAALIKARKRMLDTFN